MEVLWLYHKFKWFGSPTPNRQLLQKQVSIVWQHVFSEWWFWITWEKISCIDIRSKILKIYFSDLKRFSFFFENVQYTFFQEKKFINNETVWDGLTFDILNQLAKDLNFTYEVIESPDGTWGIDIGNNTWNGVFGQVVREEVDFAAATVSITAARQNAAVFSEPYFRDRSIVLMKLKKNNDQLKLYVKPFRIEVW